MSVQAIVHFQLPLQTVTVTDGVTAIFIGFYASDLVLHCLLKDPVSYKDAPRQRPSNKHNRPTTGAAVAVVASIEQTQQSHNSRSRCRQACLN